MIGTIVTEAVLTAVVEHLLGAIAEHARGVPGSVTVDTSRARAALEAHLRAVAKWSTDVSFKDLTRARTLDESFVDLDLVVGALGPGLESGTKYHVSDLANLPGHVVVLGDPGAGKTTSLKKVAARALERIGQTPRAAVPVLIRFRDFGRRDAIAARLLDELGITLQFERGVSAKSRAALRLQVAAEVLGQIADVLLLDGLDELHPAARAHAVAELREFAMKLDKPRVLLTCRTGDYLYHIERVQTYAILPLTPEQIRKFAIRWLGVARARDFMAKVEANPYSGTEVRPLTLAHLCAIYERSGTVPDKPRTVYRKIIRLLLEEWDEQRSVRRYSGYADFAVDRKEEFLESLAFHIATHQKSHSFTDHQLQEAYLSIYDGFGLPRSDASKVAAEIQSHTGLIVQVAHDQFEFAHKSLQEYLAANYILKLPKVPAGQLFDLPNETALAVALSSSPTAYFITVVGCIEWDSYEYLAHFSEPFIRRLIVERVDWLPSRALGRAVLDLFSRTCYPDARGPRVRVEAESVAAFRDFMTLESIARSVAYVLDGSPIVAERADADIFCVTVGERGSSVRPYLVDRRVLEAAAPFTESAIVHRYLSRGAEQTEP